MAGYIALAYIGDALTHPMDRRLDGGAGRRLMTKAFNGGTFAGCVLLLLGITDAHLLALIGSTKPFLALAGVVGVLYSLHALVPR